MASKNNSRIHIDESNNDPFQALYTLLVMTGSVSDKNDLMIRYPFKGGNVSIAVPSIKYGIAFEGDDIAPFEEDGWHIEHISRHDMEPFSRIFYSVANARVAKVYALADPNVKNTSIPEEKIYGEIIRRSLPIPDRNYKFMKDDGKELTTPDFTWLNERVAFFMDGAYWHVIKQDKEMLRALKNDKGKKLEKFMNDKRSDKVANDKNISAELTSRGWLVLRCTDTDLETSEGLMEVVDRIEKTLKISRYSQEISAPANEETESMMDEILHDGV